LVGSSSEFHTEVEVPDRTASIANEKHNRRQYTVGILCALPKELKAIRALFEETHDSLSAIPGDDNLYRLGKLGGHMVVATCLPVGSYGTNSAARAVAQMGCSFLSIRFYLLVGIGGGVPSEKNDIRLGDVVVSVPSGSSPGVFQYDRGKENEGGNFEHTGALHPPPWALAQAISMMESNPDRQQLVPHLHRLAERLPEYRHPGRELDILLRTACAACSSRQDCPGRGVHVQQRTPRETDEPKIHYGIVGSGNRVVKDAAFRDRLVESHGLMCFEMEAAGVLNSRPCLVIRGICDYSDAHKNDVWQEYAAATAAVYARVLLEEVQPESGAAGGDVAETRV
jgi:nucleoside phosphorylase